MTFEWPIPPEHQAIVRAAGFELHGQHGRFVFAWRQRGPVAVVEYFVINPALRGRGYVRVAFRDTVDFLRQRGVRYIVAYAPLMAPLWRRLGMRETEPGFLLLGV